MSSNAEKIGWITNLFKTHPALLLSSLYVVASAVGMLYTGVFLWQFDINVFHYAVIGDFLVASLKDPIIWFTVIASVLLLMWDNWTSRSVARRSPGKWLRWYASERYRFLNNFIVLILIICAIYVFAEAEAQDVKEGRGDRVEVTLADASSAEEAVLLDTTGQFLFLYHEDTERVSVHPFENVASITPKPGD